jgi:aspartate aminotransferase
LKDELILAVPGVGFGAPGYFRLSYAVPDAAITGSFAGFKRAMDKV